MHEVKMSCWEFMNCGCEPGGSKVIELGVCPATTDKNSHNVNKGWNGGRFCWSIAGTLCDGKIHDTFVKNLEHCLKCKFYLYVEQHEGRHLVLLRHDTRYTTK